MAKVFLVGFLLLPVLIHAEGYRVEPHRLAIEPEHWESWHFPQNTVTTDPAGVRPAFIQPSGNAVLDVSAFAGGILAAGSNTAAAPRILDGDPATYWAPDIEGRSENWWVEIDLGRIVNATRIDLRFVEEDEGDPFYQFRVLTSNGSPAFSGAKNLAYTQVGRTEKPNTLQRLFSFAIHPLRPADANFVGNPIRYVMVQMTDSRLDKAEEVTQTRYESLDPDKKGAVEYYRREASGKERLVDFDQYQALGEENRGPIKYYRREAPRLADIEVWTPGDNLTLEIIDRGGELEGFGSLGSEVLITDGDFTTTWDTPSAYANPVEEPERNLFIDLGAMFWLEQIQFMYQVTQASGPFPNYVASLSDGTRAPDGSLVWIPVAAQGVGAFNTIGYAVSPDEEIREYQAIQFPLTKARFFRLDYLIQVYFGCSGLGCSASMREVQFYGRGFLPEVVMESELIELGSRPRTLVTIDWDAEIPEGTQLQVRTRSGNQLEQKIHYYNKSGGEVTEKQYRKLLSFQRGDSLVTSIPGTDWSPWSQYYQAPGARITSPSPRRYTMIQAALVSARPDRAVRLRSLAVQLEDPLVSRLVGEISPGRVSKAGEEELFTLYLHPFFQRGDAGFDQLLIEIPQGAELSLLDVAIGPESDHRDGTARRLNIDELTLTETGTDSLWIALPEIVEGTTEELVALRFATLLFQPGNVFGVSAGLQDGGKIVWQRADQGNATQLEKNNSLTVLTSFKEKIIHDLQVRPNPFTPNRDGINDLQTFAFSVFKINVEKSLFLEIYALSGQLLQRLNKNVTNPVGEQRLEWNGRDTAGNLVPPGMYICRVGLQVDTASQATATATQVIAVVY